MKRMLFNATYAEELRVAAVEGQKLINFDIETSSKEQRRGNIYKGFITRVEPSLEACFVDYGTEKQGFLPFKEIDFRYLPEVNGQRGREFSKLPVGTELIVQVEKDERGNKGAALTSYVTLPGRYLVLMPNNSRAGGISRRIEGEERDELKTVMAQLDTPQGMSVILRTAALGRVIEELQWDLTYLLKLWTAIRSAAEEQTGSFLIYQESSLVIRSIRDHFSPDISEILIDTEEVYTQAKQFMAHVMPNFADRIKLYRDDVPLFSRFQIEHQIESAYSRTVHLPSGGAIVIDHTEALTSVDVNSAKANKGADIEATAYLTNLEAAEEVARQLRLRDLGGLVVVDYIDMENPRNQRDLENHFKAQLSLDRARIQMGKLSKFGLLELSRQRLQASLDESSAISCPRCAGVGSIRGIESSALHVLRIVQEETIKNGGRLSALHVQLPVDVATYLLNERRDDVAKIEARMKVKIILIPNVHLDSPHYKIKKLTYDNFDSNFNQSSYNLVEIPEDNLAYKATTKKSDTAINKLPVVQNIAPAEPAPSVGRRQGKSLFASFFAAIGNFFATPTAESKAKSHNRTPGQPAPRNVKQHRDNNAEDRRQGRNSRSRENVAGANDNSSNNKTRPVPVAKSNNRIQTVRPVQSNSAENKPLDEVQATARPPRNPRNNNPRNSAPKSVEASTAPREVPVMPQRNAAPIKPPVSVKNDSSVARPASEGKLSQAEKVVARPNVDTVKPQLAEASQRINHVTVKQPTVEEVKSTVAVKTVEAAPIKVEAPAVVVVPKVVKPVAVIEPVDLGGLQLVNTNRELLNKPQAEVVAVAVKRFSDVVNKERVIDPNISYELVETKR
ncbi:MAG: ribonuclease [Pseudomonadota bacterium]|nr:Rne/Rng family ribonuclease [Burkholderiales bacterium]MDQ5948471.1 ribonuclease [Pseudomonadota bacterium]